MSSLSVTDKPQLKRGMLVELDYAVLPGHKLLLECCTKRLAKEGVKLDFGLVARVLAGKTFTSGFNALCEKQGKTVDVPTVASECQDAFTTALANSLSEVPDSFVDFIKQVLSQDIRVVIVSRLPVEDQQKIFGDFTHPDLTLTQDLSTGFGFFSWSTWRRLAHKFNLCERLTLAVTGSGLSCKNAMICAMGSIARPNELTDYQDFTGCDRLFKEFSSDLIPGVLSILRV